MTIFLMPGQTGAPPSGQCGEPVELWPCERSRKAGENILEGKIGGRRDRYFFFCEQPNIFAGARSEIVHLTRT